MSASSIPSDTQCQLTGFVFGDNFQAARLFVPGFKKEFLLNRTKHFFPSSCLNQWVTFTIDSKTGKVDESIGFRGADDYLPTHGREVLIKCNRVDGEIQTVYKNCVQDPQDVFGSYGIQDFTDQEIWIRVGPGAGSWPSFIVAPSQSQLGVRIRPLVVEQNPLLPHRPPHYHHPQKHNQRHQKTSKPDAQYQKSRLSYSKYHTEEVKYGHNQDSAYSDKALFSDNDSDDEVQPRFDMHHPKPTPSQGSTTSQHNWITSRHPSPSQGPSAYAHRLTSSRLPSPPFGLPAHQHYLPSSRNSSPPQSSQTSGGPTTSEGPSSVWNPEALKEVSEYRRPVNMNSLRSKEEREARSSRSFPSATSSSTSSSGSAESQDVNPSPTSSNSSTEHTASSESNESKLIAELLKNNRILEEQNKKLEEEKKYKNGREENALTVVTMLQTELITTDLAFHLQQHSTEQGSNFFRKLQHHLYKY